ncbi:MAG: DUF6522 family protein [Ferrovibrio sp.]
MRILIEDGHPVVDAAEIAPLLDLDVATFQKMMQAGRIGTRTERGIGEDEGRLRLTLTSPSLRLRLTCGADGEVLKQSRVRLTPDRDGSSSQKADASGAPTDRSLP